MLDDNARLSPPTSNRGGVSGEICDAPQMKIERYQRLVINEKGEIQEIPLRRGFADGAFVDTLSVTFGESSLRPFSDGILGLVCDEDYIFVASKVFYDIFGFGVSRKGSGKGNRRYDGFWLLEADGVQYGSVHFGGQNGTMLLELNGHGCEAARDGWEGRLYSFLKGASRPKITRIDIAVDFFQNEITPDKAYRAWSRGGFSVRQRPVCECYGTDWDCDTNNGKTFYVGGKESAKRVRVYDKAKQLGDKISDWIRFEIQFRANRDLILELEMLLWPGQYFGGAYPICAELVKVRRSRRPSTVMRCQLSFDSAVHHGANQVGRLLNLLLELGKTPEEIVGMLRNKDGALPVRLQPASFSVEDASGNDTYLHDLVEEYQQTSERVDVYRMNLPDEGEQGFSDAKAAETVGESLF